MLRVIFLFILSLYFLFFSFAELIELEKITVEKNPFKESTSSIDYFLKEDFEKIPFNSIEEIIDYTSSVDLRKRAIFGIQQDISLRGSIFEDAFIYLEDIKINHPQTGHFNLELPLTIFDLEKIEIYKNSQKINFTFKKPLDKGFIIKSSFGEHAFWQEGLSVSFPTYNFKNRFSLEHKSSKGARQNTDFDIYNFSYCGFWKDEYKELELISTFYKKDFGADSFYAQNFPQEEEHIKGNFLLFSFGLEEELFKNNTKLYLKKHLDKYILDRYNPSFYTNYHTTYIYGLKNTLEFNNGLFLENEIVRETIDSSNLNKHYRLKKGILFGIKEKKIERFIFDSKFGLDYYENWEFLENFHLGLGYFLKSDLKLRFSFDKIWRAPTFVELYYSSPANRGNPELDIQKTNNYELGLDLLRENLFFSTSIFFKEQFNTIDWQTQSLSEPFCAKNIGSLNTYGLDLYFKVKLRDNYLKDFSLGYTYLNLNRKSPFAFSKYIFDYVSHKTLAVFGLCFEGIDINLIPNFSKPIKRKGYTTLDLKIEKKIKNLTFSIEGTNIFNKNYNELNWIRAEGRWFKFTLIYTF